MNASVGSEEVLVESGVGLFLGTVEVSAILFIGLGYEGFETVYLTSKKVEHLVGVAPPMVGVSTRTVSRIDVVFSLDVIAD